MFVLFWVTFLIIGGVFSEEKDVHHGKNLEEVAGDYIYESIKNLPHQLFTEPTNNLSSIKYALYTPSNPKAGCFIEPTPKEFDYCSFNPIWETKFLIHGFIEILKPSNLFEELKDTLLYYGNYNIFIVDWTLHNTLPVLKAYENALKVGKNIAKTMRFIINHTSADQRQFHCIGHSLGAHVCGVAARIIPNFHRITGLDPGGLAEFLPILDKIVLRHTDANYVDVVHTSAIETGVGLGTIQPIGDIDFYVNGGVYQNGCKIGTEYKIFGGDILKVETIWDIIMCNHLVAIVYFTNSIYTDCEFIGTRCGSFMSAILNPVFKLCSSNSSVTATMGFRSEKIPGLPPKSVFYVDVSKFSSYCKGRK